MEPSHSRTLLFLDANVLISAAWKQNAETALIWQLDDIQLVTSIYVMTEVQRNLPLIAQVQRLRTLMTAVKVEEMVEIPELVEALALPEKDRPVLAAAVQAKADLLITGDKRHFSQWFGKTVCGVRIEPPTDLLKLFRLRRL